MVDGNRQTTEGIDRRTTLKIAGAASTAALTGLAGCSAIGGGESDWERSIGVTTSLTGPVSEWGQDIDEVGSPSEQIINEEMDPDLSGISIDDTAGSIEEARSLIQGLIEDGVPALTGTLNSHVVLGIKERIEEEGVPHIAPVAGAPEITDENSDYSFRMVGSNEQVGIGALQFLESKDISNLAVLTGDYAYGRSVANALEEHASDYGITIDDTFFVPHPENDNFQPELNQIDTDTSEALFFPYPSGSGVSLINQAHELGLPDELLMMGDLFYASTGLRPALGENLENVYHWGADLSTPMSQRLQESIDGTLSAPHVIGFDCNYALASAMNEADSVEPSEIASALRDLNLEGANGFNINFGEHGHNEGFQMVVNNWVMEDGELQSKNEFISDPIPSQ